MTAQPIDVPLEVTVTFVQPVLGHHSLKLPRRNHTIMDNGWLALFEVDHASFADVKSKTVRVPPTNVLSIIG